jgi:hypothetical protein
MTKAQAVAIGGTKTSQRYGTEHYKRIGRLGGLYRLPTLEELKQGKKHFIKGGLNEC